MNKLLNMTLLATALTITMSSCSPKVEKNPFMEAFNTPEGAPAFDQIKFKDYEPAFDAGIEEQNKNIEAITSNPAAPTFDNTIVALDESSPILDRVSGVFFNLTESDTNEQMTALAQKLAPLLSEHGDNIRLNAALYKRVAAIYNQRKSLDLTSEQTRLLEDTFKGFVRSGAALNQADKDQLRKINSQLSTLTLSFSNHLLKEVNRFQLEVKDSARLSGIPAWLVEAAAKEAAKANKPGEWIFTLQTSNRIPILQYADDRNIRREMYEAYTTKGNHNDELDNKKILKDIISLRLQKAKLLGFESYADYILDNNMAKTPEAAMNLLTQVWEYALPKAKEERKALQKLMDRDHKGQKIAAWDWWYYTEKLRAEKFALNEDDLKPYLTLDNVRNGAFMCAHKLYGINIEPAKDIPVYTDGVDAYRVKDADGSLLGVFYTDYFPRAGKRGGAWMNNFRAQKAGVRPVIVNVCSMTPPVGDKPSMLTIDEVETIFHEFGHALHGLLSQCQYKGTSGTSVARDFVELPSQINEHWALNPTVLKMYAKNYKTGEVIPDSLIAKIESTHGFNQGFNVTELIAASILDMKLHMLTDTSNLDIEQFEKETMNNIGLIPEIAPRYRLTYFNHIMGGYDAGYYAYTWAKVLDCDAFASFEKNGIFDTKTATSFRKNILEKGNSEDQMVLYKKFKGAAPSVEPMLRMSGLK